MKFDGSEDEPFYNLSADPKPKALRTLDAGTRVPAKECGLTGLDSGGLRSSIGPAAAETQRSCNLSTVLKKLIQIILCIIAIITKC